MEGFVSSVTPAPTPFLKKRSTRIHEFLNIQLFGKEKFSASIKRKTILYQGKGQGSARGAPGEERKINSILRKIKAAAIGLRSEGAERPNGVN